MQNSTIFGQIKDYEMFDVPGKQQVVLTMGTSWSGSYPITLDGEDAVDAFMEEHGVETLHALKGLSFAIEIAAVIDEETGRPTGFGPVSMELLDDHSPLVAVERAKRGRFVSFELTRNKCLSPCAN